METEGTKVKELTEEEIKAEEDAFFQRATHPGSMQRIVQGGEFLEEGPAATMFDDEEAAERMRKEAQETFNKCAQIAALENNPGMSLIFDQIENMAAALHKNNEAMMQGGTLDPNKMQANIMAAVKLKELKIWIQSKMEGYKREIGIKGSA